MTARADNIGFVGIFDSGLGGLSVWREVARQLPCERTLYLADQAHVPYGSRPLAEVRELSRGIARFMLDQGAKAAVVACNSASAAALHDLRRSFPDVPFVGMEPAVKPAVERTRTGVVGVIATQATFQGELFASLMERYAGDARVLSQVCPGLVEAVEAGAWDTAGTEALLRRCLSPLMAAGMDQLVLGCTHYPFLQPAIRRIVGAGVAIIDPARAVARQVARVLAQHGMEAAPSADPARREGRSPRHLFCTSGEVKPFASLVGRLVSLDAAGIEVRSVHWSGGRLGFSPRSEGETRLGRETLPGSEGEHGGL